jgi:hypothetical protein
MTDGQSAGLSWCQARIWGLRPDFYYCHTVTFLLMWGALSDKRTGLSFTIAAGPHQRIHSLARAPWVSRPYYTVSDSSLSFVAFYDLQGYGGGIRPRLHTGQLVSLILELVIIFRHGSHRKHVPRVRLRVHWSVTNAGRGADDIENTVS